jgi:hypothetical protein
MFPNAGHGDPTNATDAEALREPGNALRIEAR